MKRFMEIKKKGGLQSPFKGSLTGSIYQASKAPVVRVISNEQIRNETVVEEQLSQEEDASSESSSLSQSSALVSQKKSESLSMSRSLGFE